MKSTLYLKFIFIYIVFGFLSLFTAATLTETTSKADVYEAVRCYEAFLKAEF